MTPAIAKERARLLRQELAAAGFDVPHSLTLELVAHQHGFRDWNTLAATQNQIRSVPPRVERDDYVHASSPITLGELRLAMEGRPDDTPVLVSHPDEPGGTRSSSLPAVSAVVRPSLLHDQQPALTVAGDFPSGTYLLPRRLTLELSGIEVDEESEVAAAIKAVEAAIDALGYRDEWWMSNDVETGGGLIWQFRANGEVPLTAIEAAVRRATARHSASGWVVAATEFGRGDSP
ncbi:DUF6225 family protein [Nocardioides dongkuii]|uniref:DUF6225 family protein n=1 Tax=Nocardioides dongkuii TaxID=2760089 RepID=UPI001878B483|nr:glyoxalase superfamily protein [Nocardioides dongkuii]